MASSSAAEVGLSRQLSLLAINELSEPLSWRVGSESAVPKKPADCNEGPIPRMATLLGELPVIMKPPMATFSPASTCKRVEMFKGWTASTGVGVAAGCSHRRSRLHEASQSARRLSRLRRFSRVRRFRAWVAVHEAYAWHAVSRSATVSR